MIYFIMFQSLLQKFKQNQRKILLTICGTLAITGVAFLAYRTLNKNKNLTTPSQTSRDSHLHRQTQQPTQEKSLIKVLNSVRKEVGQHSFISFQAVKAIYRGQFVLSQPSYQKIVQRNRQQRRKWMMDVPRYIQLIHSLENQLQELHDKNLDAILAHFKFTKLQWRQLVLRFQMEQPDEWLQMILGADMDQQSSLRSPTGPELDSAKIHQIYEYKLNILRVVILTARQFVKESDAVIIYPFLERRMSDLVYLQFHVQDEDIFVSLSKLSPDEAQNINKLEETLNQVLRQELGLE